MIEHLAVVPEWVSAHPGWTLAILFLCCTGESILVLGMLIPTTVVLLAAGALVALGSLELGPVMAVSVLGAVFGDSLNFWAGRHWGRRALESHYAQKYQDPIARSQNMFERHGAKALVVARFVGLVRPFVAAIAGAYRMSHLRFFAVEFFAAALWAVPLVLLGVVFGASLGLAAEVATRLAILLVSGLVVLALLVWLTGVAVGGLQDHAGGWLARFLDWSRRHRQLGRLGGWLADPAQPETPALAVLALLLFGIGWLWLELQWSGAGAPGTFDTLVWQGVQGLRTPVTTAIAVSIEQLSDWQIYAPVALTVFVTLLLLDRTRAAIHWLAAVAFGAALSLGLYALLTVPDPVNYFRGEPAVHFGGRDLVLATVIYGFLPVLLTTQRSQAVRSVYYAATTILLVAMLFAGVYLGAVWMSTGLFAITFGAIWVTLLGIGYRRHGAEPIPAREVLPLAIGALMVAATLHASAELRREWDLPGAPERPLSGPAWWNGAYAELPAYRIDAAGLERQPLTVQWRGNLERIESALQAEGWERPPALSLQSSLRWLAISAPLGELPVLPQVHADRHEALTLRKLGDGDTQTLLRLWPSGRRIGSLPLWIGTLTEQTGRRALRLVRYPRTGKDYDTPIRALKPVPAGFELRAVQHPRRDAAAPGWDGRVLLLRPAN